MDSIDYDRPKETFDEMDSLSDLSERLRLITASERSPDSGHAAFPPLSVFLSPDQRFHDGFQVLTELNDSASATAPPSVYLQKDGGKVQVPFDFQAMFSLPLNGSDAVSTSAPASSTSLDGPTTVMDVCVADSGDKLSGANFQNLFSLPPNKPSETVPATKSISCDTSSEETCSAQAPVAMKSEVLKQSTSQDAAMEKTTSQTAASVDHMDLFRLPPPSHPQNAATAKCSAETSASGEYAHLFQLEPLSTSRDSVTAESSPPSSPSSTSASPSQIEKNIPSPKWIDTSSPEFASLLNEFVPNVSTPAGILRGHANSLRQSHDETTHRLVVNLQARHALSNLATQLQTLILLHRRGTFHQRFPAK